MKHRASFGILSDGEFMEIVDDWRTNAQGMVASDTQMDDGTFIPKGAQLITVSLSNLDSKKNNINTRTRT